MEFEFDIDRESPFEPSKPVSPDNFKGRIDTIKKILRYANKAKKGNVQHFFLTGKRGMGKTSLAKYVQNYLEAEFDMVGVYVSNKGNNSLESLVNSIIEALLNVVPKESLKDKVKDLFGKIESVEIKNMKVTFRPDAKISKDLVNSFPYYIDKIIKEVSNDYNGVFLIIDDINGLSESKEFVDWYKRFADTIEVNDDFKIPLYVLFAGYPEKFDNLVQQEESFGRIFHHEKIDSLADDDVKEFFIDTFAKEKITLDNDSLSVLTYFSSGLPLMMQQIGDSVFWFTEDNEISEDVAIQGVVDAANEIGNKQIRPILNKIRSENYEPILLKLGELKAFKFKRSDINKELKTNEQKVFKAFLSRMVELGILNSIGKKNSGEYEFNNQLYFIYFLIKSTLKN